ncbi:MAG: regulatory protein RecX [bacterium]
MAGTTPTNFGKALKSRTLTSNFNNYYRINMKITALKAQIKNPNRVSIFVEAKYVFSLTIDDVLTYKLKKDSEITESDIAVYKKLSSDGKIKTRTYEWLLNRPHSTKELKEYLYHKQVDKELQDKLVEDFTNKGILSDERFADWSAERLLRKNKSSRAIVSELRSKGVDQVTIQSIVSREGSNDGLALKQLITKLSTRSRYADQKKLITYLLSKGFSYGDVKEALNFREPEQEP